MIHARVGRRAARGILAGSLFVLLGTWVDAATVRQWADALAVPAAAAKRADAAGKGLSLGHLELRFASGRVARLEAHGRLVGVVFDGVGSFRYRSVDPFEKDVFRSNVAGSSSWKLDGNAVGDTLSRLVLLSSDPAPLETSGFEWKDAGPDDPVEGLLAATIERFARDVVPDDALLVAHGIVEANGRATAAALLVGAKHDARWRLDPLRAERESLSVLRERKTDAPLLVGERLPDTLSEQVAGRGRLDPRSPRFLLSAVDLDLVNREGLRGEFRVVETLAAVSTVRVVDFGLLSSRYGTVGVTGRLVSHPLRVKSVTFGGQALPFVHSEHELLVELPAPLPAGYQAVLTFEYEGEILFTPGNDSYWLLPIADWLPTPTRMEEQSFSWHATVRVPRPLVPFSCGKTVRRWEEERFVAAEFREEKPIQFPVVLAGKYVTEAETRDGLTVSISSYAGSNPGARERLTRNAFALVEFYRPFFGDFPFAELKIIEINALGFGVAPAGIIFITSEAFSPLRDEATRYFSEGVNNRLAHEVAHSWWGHVAKMASRDDQWLSESVAEYFSAVAMSRLRSGAEMDKAVRQWRDSIRTVKDRGSVFSANQAAGTEAGWDRTDLLYAKGPLVLHHLRRLLGDEAFFRVWKGILDSQPFRHLDTARFFKVAGFVAKRDLHPDLDGMLFGVDWPPAR